MVGIAEIMGLGEGMEVVDARREEDRSGMELG